MKSEKIKQNGVPAGWAHLCLELVSDRGSSGKGACVWGCLWVGGFLENPTLMPLSVSHFAIMLRICLLPGKCVQSKRKNIDLINGREYPGVCERLCLLSLHVGDQAVINDSGSSPRIISIFMSAEIMVNYFLGRGEVCAFEKGKKK